MNFVNKNIADYNLQQSTLKRKIHFLVLEYIMVELYL